MIYEPREDSYLMQECVRSLAKGRVLDMGTGSGIQALTAAKKKSVKKVLAVDISKAAIKFCKEESAHKKIRYKVSDLFSKVEGRYDVIIFNPPYLPADAKLGDLTLEGGKKGYETVLRFLDDANTYLKDKGIVLLLVSSLTKPKFIEDYLGGLLMDYRVIADNHLFFEDLFVYKIWKNNLRKALEHRKIKHIKYFAKGKRGLVYTGVLGRKKIAIKMKSPTSFAVGRIKNEKNMLRKLNKKGIGPRFRMFFSNTLVYEFVEGDFLKDYVKKASKKKIKDVFKEILKQCYTMDMMGINKEEMHHPLKHVVVGEKIVQIDFERARAVEHPQNVTQFCNYISVVFPEKRKRLIELARVYKKDRTKKNFEKILRVV